MFKNTYYFQYKKKRYAFDIDKFCKNSTFFDGKRDKLEKEYWNKTINILDEFDVNLPLEDDTIKKFLEFAQNSDGIEIDCDNAIQLNALANRFHVKALLELTRSSVIKNHEIIINKILDLDQSMFNVEMEKIISTYLYKFVNDERIFILSNSRDYCKFR